MTDTEKIDLLKKEILSDSNPEKEALLDNLIELEGFEAMQFIQSLFLIDPFQKSSAGKGLTMLAAYGVKKLLKLRAIESVNDFKYCPDCKSDLHKYEIIDRYSVGLKCLNNHKFHIDIQQNDFYEKSLTVNKNNNIEIAKEWLNNENYRKNINSQIAEVLRKFIESSDLASSPENQNILEKYCPVCSLSLKEFKQEDVWVKELKCTNDHIFHSRNGLSYNNSTLKPDIDKTQFQALIESYLNSDQKEQLPGQIAALFEEIN